MSSFLLMLVVYILIFIALLLAYSAEQRRSTARTVTNTNASYCVYDLDISTGFGMGALLSLMASQLLIMSECKCLFWGRVLRPGHLRDKAIVLFIACWVTFTIAEVCLLFGIVRNTYHTKYRPYLTQNPPSCETLRWGAFSAGAAFIVFNGILSQQFYLSYLKTVDGFVPRDRDAAIRMGFI